MTIEVETAQAGEHILVVHYANDERDAGHPHNTDIVSRPIDISVNGGGPARHWFKNTWSWGNWWARSVDGVGNSDHRVERCRRSQHPRDGRPRRERAVLQIAEELVRPQLAGRA